MQRLLRVLGIALLLSGLLWAAQGAGIVRWPADSFMIDTRSWVVYGLITAAAGIVLVLVSRRVGRR